MKLDYLPGLTNTEINDAQLKLHVEKLTSNFQKKLDEISLNKLQLNYKQVEDIYDGDEQLRSDMKELENILKDCQADDLITVSLVLSFDLLYHSDFLEDVNLWKLIDSQIDFNYHIFSFRQKCRTMYALSGKFPKKCTFALRTRILQNLIKQDFNGLSLEELMMFRTATRNENNNDYSFRKFYTSILKRKKQLAQLPPESELSIDLLYTFYNCILKRSKREELIHKREEDEEEIAIWDFFSELIYGKIPSLSISGLMRLTSCLEMRKIELGNEIGQLITRRFNKIKEDLDIDLVLNFVNSFSSLRKGAGVGDEQFWKEINKFIEKKMKVISEIDSKFLIFRLLTNLTSQGQISESSFYKNYIKLIDQYLLDYKNASWDCLHQLSIALPCFQAQFPQNKEIERLLKDLSRCMCLQNIPSTYIQHYHLKMFRIMMEAKYPEWNLDNMDITGYHAEKEFSPLKLKETSMTLELRELISIIQAKLELDLTPLLCYENSFLIDLANEEAKYAVILKTKDNVRSSSKPLSEFESCTGSLKADKVIQQRVLEANDWKVLVLDYDEFKSHKNKRAEWLLDVLQKGYEEAVENAPNPGQTAVEELLEEILFVSKTDFQHVRDESDQKKQDEYYAFLDMNVDEIKNPNFVDTIDFYAEDDDEIDPNNENSDQ